MHSTLHSRTSFTQTSSGGTAAVARPLQGSKGTRANQQTVRAGNFFKDFLDFNSWAPKSTRIWRLQQYQPPEPAQPTADAGSDASSVLQDRINQLKDSQETSSTASSSRSSGAGSYSSFTAGPADDSPATASFSDADDSEVSAALSKRIRQIATTTGEWGSSMDEEEMRQPLTGEEIRQLLITKYGKQYDMSFVRRNLPGMGPCVSLNIMWLHVEQASFKMTPQQYAEKLDSVAALVNVLGQTDKVRAFLKAPARSMKGLPRRPVVGTAISIRLDLTKAQISEWFGQGYD